MPAPVTSRETPLYTPSEPEKNVCTSEAPLVCAGDVGSGEPDSVGQRDPDAAYAPPSAANPSHASSAMDYFTVSGGASAIIGGDVSLTLDRYGHLYVGLGAGVGASAAVVSASIHGGRLTGPADGAPTSDELKGFLKGDCVQGSAGIGPEVGVTNAATGTAAEVGLGVPQAGAQFQHNWYVLDLPIAW